MEREKVWALGPDVEVVCAGRDDGGWVIEAVSISKPVCPRCGKVSGARHSSYIRRLRDLPVQGEPATVKLRVGRWRCCNEQCDRRIFAAGAGMLAVPSAQRTRRAAEIVRVFGHAAGGRPAERLLARLGMPTSDDTILRHLKRDATARAVPEPRVIGIDEWAWQKGRTFGTIIVDLEAREVVDVLPDRSSAATAAWLRRHPSVEIINRDRQGLYAEGARLGAPQARQVADRFHLAQNFRGAVERQLSRLERPLRAAMPRHIEPPDRRVSGGPDARPRSSRVRSEAAVHRDLVDTARREMQRSMFMRVRALYEAGHNAKAIAGKLGLGRRRVDRWIRLEELPERQTMAAKFFTPAYFREYLSRRWAEGCTHAGRLFEEIKRLGYSGSYSHLARLLSPWRHAAGPEPTTPTQRPNGTMLVDPETNRTISPLVAAALCVRPRKMLTARQAAKVDALKVASHEFAAMRALAMRFRGLLRAESRRKLERWIKGAQQSGIYAMQRFARTLRQDIGAVRNAVTVGWSNGPTEGHINRLKTLKRAMYGRAGVELLRARVLPLPTTCLHPT